MRLPVIATLVALFCAPVQAQDEAAPAHVSIASLEAVLVTGEQPGPGLWKVTKQSEGTQHTLWILGTHGPLPKKMTWRSKEVEAVIAESQEVLAAVKIDVDVDVGFFATLAALPSLVNATNNPDDAKLKDIVPADVYAKWLTLKEKYIGRDGGVEEVRPTFAMQTLQSKARDKVGLASSSAIWPTVSRLAKKHQVKIVQPEVSRELKVAKPRAMLKKFRKVQLADVECFKNSLDRLEADLEAMKARANAWAIGDVEKLRRLPDLDPSENCLMMLQQAALQGQLAEEVGAQDLLKDAVRMQELLTKEAAEKWLAAAETALSKNKTTFAVLPVFNLLDADGYLAKLKAKGYAVEEP
ncbi:MAG: TraB/GumN family protein [Candidatus Obscuribacterales bacterium]|nr:TraB/GumN family protein [Steroidobacteraceae bacterium]